MNRVIAGLGVLFYMSLAFAGGGATASQLGDLPPDLQIKIAQLGQVLGEAIQDGRLTDAQVQSALKTGDAAEMIRGLGPKAAQLLQDIASGFKMRYTEEELSAILGGLIIAK
ncbi:MAG TPA: hypothetical protein VGJ57_00775 [Nitrospirales bacterium]